MGAADGPRFAPVKFGSKPIISPPCKCAECVRGPGLDPIGKAAARLERILGPINKLQCWDWCPGCQATVRCTSTRTGSGWSNRCDDHGHTWPSFDEV